MLARGTITNR